MGADQTPKFSMASPARPNTLEELRNRSPGMYAPRPLNSSVAATTFSESRGLFRQSQLGIGRVKADP